MEKRILRTTPIKLTESIMNEVTPPENTPLEEIPQRVQVMRTCTFYHDQYGKVDITRQLFSEMITNFEKNTRGIDIMIDYSHDSEAEAAGWVKGLEIIDHQDESQLWATVDWTPRGRKTLSDKEFGYLSADFDPSYEDNETPDVNHGAVLLGAGLTNRPVIKRMNPAIQLAEYNDESQNKENTQMDENKEIKKELTEEQEKQLAGISNLLSELELDSMEDLMSMIKSMRKDNDDMKESALLSEKKDKLNKLLSEGKITGAQKEEAMKLEKTSFDSYVKLADMSKPVVKLSEEGSEEAKEEEDNRDVEEVIAEKAMELCEKEEISLPVATARILSENADLKKKYENLGKE